MAILDPNIMHDYKISLLLPTRGRTQSLETSIRSLIDLAHDISGIEIRLAFDEDDQVGKEYFKTSIEPLLSQREVSYTALEFPRLGYKRLNVYYNLLAKDSRSDWLFAWNDDAIMQTKGWDQEITKYSGQFRLLRVRTHQGHPYSIFPIWPREWFDLFGFASRHQMIDAELSQIAYMLDIMQNIDVEVIHDRADLTGNNQDDTQKNKFLLEGNPENPLDFHNKSIVQQRLQDCHAVSVYLEKQGHDMTWWHRVRQGQQDPWEKLRQNDANGLTKIIQVKK
jgi:hypothetical protein